MKKIITEKELLSVKGGKKEEKYKKREKEKKPDYWATWKEWRTNL